VLSNLSTADGVVDVRVDNLPAGSYTVKGLTAAISVAISSANGGVELVNRFGENIFKVGAIYGPTTVQSTTNITINSSTIWSPGMFDSSGNEILNSTFNSATVTATFDGGSWCGTIVKDVIVTANLGHMSGTAKILLEVTNVDTALSIVTIKAVALVTRANGTTETFVQDGLTISTANGLNWTAFGLDSNVAAGKGNILNALTAKGAANANALGSKAVISIIDYTGLGVIISGNMNKEWDGYWGNGSLPDAKFGLASINNKDVAFRNFYLNSVNGQVHEQNITLVLNSDFNLRSISTKNIATFEATYIGQTARMDTQLRDLDKFWDANGKFMLDDPQTLTITQGDGKTAKVTLYATDTIGDVVNKLNNTIAYGLDQVSHLNNNDEHKQRG